MERLSEVIGTLMVTGFVVLLFLSPAIIAGYATQLHLCFHMHKGDVCRKLRWRSGSHELERW